MNENYSNAIDWNLAENAVLQYIEESTLARTEYLRLLSRVSRALVLGEPCRNYYQEEIDSAVNEIHDVSRRESVRKKCKNLPKGNSTALRNGVATIAAQMASGVDTYECTVDDPYMVLDPETADLLAAKCQQDYEINDMGELASTFSNDLLKCGMVAVMVEYDPIYDKNKVVRWNPKNIIWDTRYSSTGKERFRACEQMINWNTLKKMIERDNDEVNLTIKAPDRQFVRDDGTVDKAAKIGQRKIRSINGLDIYVESMNKLACSSSLQSDWMSGAQELGSFDHDLRTCYNLGWYRSLATSPEAKTKSNYQGNDVCLTTLYDLCTMTEYKIINHRYVISRNSSKFHRKLAIPIKDPRTGEVHMRVDDFAAECPLKLRFCTPDDRDALQYPWTPLFGLLDDHDKLCSWIAKREHVTRLVSLLRVETNALNADELSGLLNIMGATLTNTQGDIGTVQFAYDYTPIDSEITRLEDKIRKTLSAYSEFDALQMMGDRATAAESGQAQGAIAEGLAVHQNTIMRLYADIAKQCIMNRVIYSPRQEFPVVNNGNYSSLAIWQMAMTAIVNVRPKNAIKLNERATAANALQLIGNLAQTQLISKDGIAVLAEKALFGTVSRKQAETFIMEQQQNEQERATAQLQAQNMANALAQNQAAYEQNPVPYEVGNVMANNSPEQIDQIISQLGAQGEAPESEGVPSPSEIENMGMDMGDESTMGLDLSGFSPEDAGVVANMAE